MEPKNNDTEGATHKAETDAQRQKTLRPPNGKGRVWGTDEEFGMDRPHYYIRDRCREGPAAQTREPCEMSVIPRDRRARRRTHAWLSHSALLLTLTRHCHTPIKKKSACKHKRNNSLPLSAQLSASHTWPFTLAKTSWNGRFGSSVTWALFQVLNSRTWRVAAKGAARMCDTAFPRERFIGHCWLTGEDTPSGCRGFLS